MSTILIRAAEPEDVPAITEVMNQPRAAWGTMQVPFTSVAARRVRFDATPPAHVRLVAVMDDRVVALAGLEPGAHRRRVHAASIGMSVHDDFAGRGVGTALMAALIDQADNWLNIRRLELTVYTDNTRAIALYERFGFEREGVLRAYAFREGGYVDALTMARLRL